MIQASRFLDVCKTENFRLFSGTPCSYLKPLINAVINDPDFEYLDATNEGDAVALVGGAHVAGKKGIVMFQNSGFGNAVNALTSLVFPFRFPFMMIVAHRGQPGGPPDEPQHELMGQITEELLDTLRIKWEYFPSDPGRIGAVFRRANRHMSETSLPYALVIRKGDVGSEELKSRRDIKAIGTRTFQFEENLRLDYRDRCSRIEALQVILKAKLPRDVMIATTGKTGRELYTLDDAENHLYMVGSMGSTSSFSLGLALNIPDRRVFCIDGDASILMRMGNLASIGAYSPQNLVHIVLDNEVNDSTGGQSTPTKGISLALVAKACGYSTVYSSDQLVELESQLTDLPRTQFPVFIHFRIKKGSPKDLGRPKIKPFEVKRRLMNHLQGESLG
ncbi:MAG: phosphonopyruvate decarboxylase [Proteobacteria bacterium]|nr:phosphonopyruvate decarboxylase [Pseudomonadota bacterium]